MPNVVVEHSSNIKEVKSFIQLCHDHLLDSGLFKLNTIKVRPISFDDYLVAGEESKPFIVISVTVMPGRSHEDRSKLGDTLHQNVIELCQELNLNAATSVVIKETPEGLYFKQNPS